jgi:hypothetical protein
MFYGSKDCFAVNDISYKKTQFNYMPGLEDKFEGKTVAFVSYGAINKSSREVKVPKGKTYYVTIVPGFTSFTGVNITASNFTHLKAAADTSVSLSIDYKLTDKQKAILSTKSPYVLLTFFNIKTNQAFSYKYQNLLLSRGINFPFKAPAEKGDYACVFSFMVNGSISAGFNSNVHSCRVE